MAPSRLADLKAGPALPTMKTALEVMKEKRAGKKSKTIRHPSHDVRRVVQQQPQPVDLTGLLNRFRRDR